MIPDNHNHYIFAGDIDAMVAAAERAGVGEIAFCEHVFHIDEALAAMPYLQRWTPEGPPVSHERYAATVRAAGAAGSIPVRLGIELDARPDDLAFEAATAAFAAEWGADWDVVLGSVHVLAGDVSIQDQQLPMTPEEAWADYLGRMVAAARSGRYDVVTHPVRLGQTLRETPATVPALLDRVAEAAAAADVALEVNGFDLDGRPDLVGELVAACARHATPVSLGSDAHRPRAAGNVLAAVPLLRQAGIGEVMRFERRIRSAVAIG